MRLEVGPGLAFARVGRLLQPIKLQRVRLHLGVWGAGFGEGGGCRVQGGGCTRVPRS